MPHAKDNAHPQASLLEKVAGTIPATLVQMFTLHPFDTIGKRVMNHKGKTTFGERVVDAEGKVTAENLARVAFLDKYDASAWQRAGSLYNGLGNGIKYKLLQATYKFSFQPEVVKYVRSSKFNDSIQTHLHPSMVNPVQQAIGGATAGAIEVFVVLPIDMAKIKQQNNPELRYKSLSILVGQEIKESGLRGAYKGAGITIGRNVPGSAALFCFPAMVSQFLFGCDKQDATGSQKTAANAAGSLASLFFSSPQDVIKVRMQSVLGKATAWDTASKVFADNGLRGFYKGFGVKCLTQIPKTTVVFTLSDMLTKQVQSQRKRDRLGLFAKTDKLAAPIAAMELDDPISEWNSPSFSRRPEES